MEKVHNKVTNQRKVNKNVCFGLGAKFESFAMMKFRNDVCLFILAQLSQQLPNIQQELPTFLVIYFLIKNSLHLMPIKTHLCFLYISF